MRRVPEIRFAPLAAAVADPARAGEDDPVTDAILDAAAAVLAGAGLRGCTVEQVAAEGRLGRTTIYRRFEGRDDLIHAVLAREVRRGFAAISDAVAHLDRFEDRVVEGVLAGLRAVERSPLRPLLLSEPELQRLLTVEAGPLVRVAVDVLVEEDHRLRGRAPSDRSRWGAELLVRFTSSLALAPETTLPLDDDEAARRALHALLDPLLAAS